MVSAGRVKEIDVAVTISQREGMDYHRCALLAGLASTLNDPNVRVSTAGFSAHAVSAQELEALDAGWRSEVHIRGTERAVRALEDFIKRGFPEDPHSLHHAQFSRSLRHQV